MGKSCMEILNNNDDGGIERVREENRVLISACAAPYCNCPTVEVDFTSLDVVIVDDFGGRCDMTIEEFTRLCNGFLKLV